MLLALLMVVTLAAPEGAARVPGTRLRLGMTEKQVQAVGDFAESPAAATAGMEARRGELKFFGVACQATLFFRAGRLARARFEADAVSPHALAYVEDQLRRQRMSRECSRYEPTHKVCDWLGDLKVHLEITEGHLDARAEPMATPWEAPAAGTEAAPKPATGILARASGAASTAGAAAGTPAPTTPDPPAAAPVSGGTPSGATTSAAPPPPPAPASAGTVMGAVASPTAVATLPETLTISLVTKNSPSDWPRIVSSPPLEYPEAARRESVQGIVWVMVLVGPDGAVQGVQVDRGIRELNDAALAWVRGSKFAPCVREGSPCRFWVRVAVRFTLY